MSGFGCISVGRGLKMKVSVVIAIYKDTEALALILEALNEQTYQKNFEIIIAEDGQNKKVKDFITNLPYQNIIHTTQEDNGWQKNKSLNNAIKVSSGELLIFLDGDCIPYSNLVENYVKNTHKKTILCGRRVDLGQKYATKLRNKEYQLKEIENNYFRHYFKMMKDGVRHYEEGIRLPKILHKLKYRNKRSHILGCNFALNKEDILEINGFNEDYVTPSVGEDTDIEYRLIKSGCIMKPTRNLTNVVHLYHNITYNTTDHEKSMQVFKQTQQSQNYFCKNGLIQ